MPCQHLSLLRRYFALCLCRFNVFHHNGKWLSRTVFSLSEQPDRCLICSIAGKMEPTNALYSYYLAISQSLPCISDGVTALYITSNDINFRTAIRTAYRLRIISPIRAVVILSAALAAHRKVLHSCAFSVVREIFKNGKSRSALSTVNEWMQISPIVFIV